MKIIAKNRRASYDYAIISKMTAGLSLNGDEVKSIKAASTSLKGSFIALKNNEAFLVNAHVNPYPYTSYKQTHDPMRPRKLLLHREELDRLLGHKQNGMSIVPLSLMLMGSLVKLEIGVGRGKKRFDKRHTIKQRDTQRELARSLKS